MALEARFPAIHDDLKALLIERRPRRMVGAHEILREVGRGGMGVVYKARRLGNIGVVRVFRSSFSFRQAPRKKFTDGIRVGQAA